MSAERVTRRLIDSFARKRPLRAGSLLITIFGDSIAPRGGTVWLGSLIDAVGPFGVNDRLVRTSVSRLAKDDWLASEQQGRRSFYGLTETGTRRFAEATARIYGAPRLEWSGELTLALLGPNGADGRDAARRELTGLGFQALSTTLLVHADASGTDTRSVLARAGVEDDVLLLRANPAGDDETPRLRAVIQTRPELGDLRQRYTAFLDTFRPVLKALARGAATIAPALGFQGRTMLIHEYRKILLRDPLLPGELLPADWPGIAAYTLCRDLYLLTQPAADAYLSSTMENARGPLPAPEPAFYARFGGIPQPRR